MHARPDTWRPSSALNEIAGSARVGMEIDERRIPVRETVRGACELFGLDPLYVANEGKLIAIVPADEAAATLAAMKSNEAGTEATDIGVATETHIRTRHHADSTRNHASGGYARW